MVANPPKSNDRYSQLEFLAQAGTLLSTLDPEAALRTVAQLAVPGLADWCAVHLVGAGGDVRSVSVAHVDPEKVQLAEQLQQRYPPDPNAPTGVHKVVRTGKADLIPTVSAELLEAAAEDAEHLRILRGLGLRSAMVVPMTGRTRTVGAITFAAAESAIQYTEDDLRFAEELARRAGLAVENALLHAELQAELAERRRIESVLREQQQALEDNAAQLEELNAELEQTVEELQLQTEAEELARHAAERAEARTRDLQQITQRLGAALTRSEVGEVIVEPAQRALGAAQVVLLARVPGVDELEILSAAGVDASVAARWRRFSLEEPTPITEAVRDGRPRFWDSGDVQTQRYLNEDVRAALDGRAVAALPLVHEGEILGGMLFLFDPPYTFHPEERDMMLAAAGMCAQALERVRLYEAERAARAGAEAANRAKTQFLAVMSHELRTPLNAIVGYADLLDGEVPGPLNEKQKTHLQRIQGSAWHLRTMIDEVLSLSRIEAGKEEIRTQAIDANKAASEAAALIQPHSAQQGLEFRVSHAEQPLLVETDPGKLRQILLNLLSNAVKFTQRGEIELRVAEVGGWRVFQVRDTGAGIDPAFHEEIFEPFTQIDQSSTRRTGGTGLGLPVSRNLARLLGGDLTVASQPGRGSVFTLRLPAGGPP